MIKELLEHYITVGNILMYIPIILLFLVMWTFWGKSYIMEKLNSLNTTHEEHVNKVVDKARRSERDWVNLDGGV